MFPKVLTSTPKSLHCSVHNSNPRCTFAPSSGHSHHSWALYYFQCTACFRSRKNLFLGLHQPCMFRCVREFSFLLHSNFCSIFPNIIRTRLLFIPRIRFLCWAYSLTLLFVGLHLCWRLPLLPWAKLVCCSAPRALLHPQLSFFVQSLYPFCG